MPTILLGRKSNLLDFDYEQPVFASMREHLDVIEFGQKMGLGRQVAGVCNTVVQDMSHQCCTVVTVTRYM